jgi:hypothetical protein
MRRLGVLGLGAVLLLALGAAAPADDDDTKPAKPPAPKFGTRSVFEVWFGLGGKKPAARADKDKKKAAAKEAAPPRPSPVETAAAAREQEEAKLLRRNDVCLRLRQIAKDTNDPALEQMAEDLEKRAWQLYTERTHVPAGGLKADEESLDRRLGVDGEGPARLTAPGRDRGRPKDYGSAAPVREVNP